MLVYQIVRQNHRSNKDIHACIKIINNTIAEEDYDARSSVIYNLYACMHVFSKACINPPLHHIPFVTRTETFKKMFGFFSVFSGRSDCIVSLVIFQRC